MSVIIFSAPLADVLRGTKAAVAAIGKTRQEPVLSYAKIDVSDGEAWISGYSNTYGNSTLATTNFAAGTSESDAGSFLVPARGLLDILTAASKRATARITAGWTVTMRHDTEEDGILLDIHGSTAKLNAGPLSEYPSTDSRSVGTTSYRDVVGVRDVFDRALICSSTDETLPILTGIMLEFSDGNMEALVTDRYRLSRESIPVGAGDGFFLLPGLVWKRFRLMFDRKTPVTLRASHAHAAGAESGERFEYLEVQQDGLTVRFENLDGDYPKIRSLFPDRIPQHRTFDADALAAVVASIAPICERNTPIRLTMRGGVAVLDGGTGEDMHAEGSVEYGYEGDDFDEMVCAFNPKYLLEILKPFKGGKVTIGHTASPKPAIFGDPVNGDSFNGLLMPVRLA